MLSFVYADCRVFDIVILSVIMLNVIMLSVWFLNYSRKKFAGVG